MNYFPQEKQQDKTGLPNLPKLKDLDTGEAPCASPNPEDEAPRLIPKGEREPFPEPRPEQMSSKYILSWTACSCPHVCIWEGGQHAGGKTPES